MHKSKFIHEWRLLLTKSFVEWLNDGPLQVNAMDRCPIASNNYILQILLIVLSFSGSDLTEDFSTGW